MRGEVLVGPERRRRWSASERAAVVEESIQPGGSVSAVARRHGVSRSLVYKWRSAILEGKGLAADGAGPKFVPVFLTAPSAAAMSPSANAPTKPAPHEPKQRPQAAEIEVALPGGARLILRGRVEPTTLHAVLAALKA